MDRQRLDKLAMMLAATPSRRQAVRTVVAGIFSAVVLTRAPQPVAAALCPERIPKSGYTPDDNGCGPSGYGWTIPDAYGRASFTSACNRHDRCYATCNTSRLTCDYMMRKSMIRACKVAYRGAKHVNQRRKCVKRAWLYYNVVSKEGQAAYEAAQQEACECCPSDEPGTACGTKCCVPGSRCCGGTTCCANGSTCENGQCRPADCSWCLSDTWNVCCPANDHLSGPYCCPTGYCCINNATGCTTC